MDEVIDSFAWTRQLYCPLAIYNNSVQKRLCKGVLELLWEDISPSILPMAEIQKIRKNILLYKLRHRLDDFTIATVKDLKRLRSNSDTLQNQIALIKENCEDLDYNIREKIQLLKNIRTKCSTISIRKNFIKLKHNETSQQLKDCGVMSRVCQCLILNTAKDIDENKLRENLNIIANLRSTADRKQIWRNVSSSLADIDTHTLWTYLYQALSQDLDMLMKLEIKDISSFPTIGENIDISIAKACGQQICMILRRMLSNTKANKYQQHIMEFIGLVESLSHEDISQWLTLTLEIKKLETEQACLQNETQKLKNDIQDNSLLNFEIARLTTDIETIDAQMDEYVKNIQQSITILNSTASLMFEAKEKLHCELQKIAALQIKDYNPRWLSNALNVELDVFYYSLDLNALQKIMLKGDVGQYRHAIRGFNRASVMAINPQCSKIKSYFPMIHTPIYTLIDCYKDSAANAIYIKSQCSIPTEDIKCTMKSMPSREKYNDISLNLLCLSRIVYNQVRKEIGSFNATLDSWTNQNVQEVMELIKTTVDDVPFKDWMQRYSLLLYMIQKAN
ncbi:PREDICTED: uncharacterized protein LOC106752256 isoform X2 [Dinoponera quadriceps]|nr:PREDICTED: uncharacterized protein LOC106752256 isoform X2 [Dinoponera quadriceps]XP_014489312.1 PREDICTED: uncharacterized protein LOC106752256 isoform X2 [Dinoponera quadriceps]XP_014489313.1 PREDICTED: uncharacterized protein LOC106752256 isoform X2 [Dinoponera quadriceps]